MTERLFLSLCFPDKETKVLKGLSQNSFEAPSQPQSPGLCDSDGAAQSSHVASRNPINTHVPISKCTSPASAGCHRPDIAAGHHQPDLPTSRGVKPAWARSPEDQARPVLFTLRLHVAGPGDGCRRTGVLCPQLPCSSLHLSHSQLSAPHDLV